MNSILKLLGDKYGIRFAFNIKKNIENIAKEKNISENKLIENAIIEYLEDYYDYKIILEAEDRLKNEEELYSIDEVKKDLNIK
ncbi:DUF6290 family protein [uncultured Brachyspira sp.]|uniref:DUF6290 family protein n=1 Tax=uncultured Brachyspira sp. TaxID=221953 RepID=UPI0025FD5AB6|nr:DUF6290 family protein [uncultured Brachyspira sp.]